ncbi:MAG: NAD-dependent epimerase/dehydratase family protein [Planctomycetaceae bacterium]
MNGPTTHAGKALVTGGGGFLGLYVVEQLLACGNTVRVLCRGRYPRLEELRVEFTRGDVRNAHVVAAACKGVDAVFHVAATPGIWGPWKRFHGINTVGTQNVIDACRLHGVPKLIYTSSPSVIYDGKPHENVDESYPYPEPSQFLCHYPHSKMLAERAVLRANDDRLATVSLRPHLLWGPRDNHLIPRLIRRAKSGRLRRVGDGTNLISMTYVENAAVAHLQAADALCAHSANAGKAYFINEPEPVNLWDWIDELLRRGGLPPVKKRISAIAARRVGAVLETIYRCLFLPGEPPMTRFLASQLSSSHYYSIAAARRDFGYTPPVSMEEGMRRLGPELKRLAAS